MQLHFCVQAKQFVNCQTEIDLVGIGNATRKNLAGNAILTAEQPVFLISHVFL